MEGQNRAARELGFAEVPAAFGLGLLFDLDAESSGRVAELFLLHQDNKRLRTLAQNFLENYLRVIELPNAALQTSVGHSITILG
jgi:hypothetical protein